MLDGIDRAALVEAEHLVVEGSSIRYYREPLRQPCACRVDPPAGREYRYRCIFAGDLRTALEPSFRSTQKKQFSFSNREQDCSCIPPLQHSHTSAEDSNREANPSTKGKRRASRLALYLSSIGIRPVLSARSYKQLATDLQAQYEALEVGQRKTRAEDRTPTSLKKRAPLQSQLRLSQTRWVQETQAHNAPPITPRTQSREEQIQVHLPALVCAHAALSIMPDAERLPKALS